MDGLMPFVVAAKLTEEHVAQDMEDELGSAILECLGVVSLQDVSRWAERPGSSLFLALRKACPTRPSGAPRIEETNEPKVNHATLCHVGHEGGEGGVAGGCGVADRKRE